MNALPPRLAALGAAVRGVLGTGPVSELGDPEELLRSAQLHRLTIFLDAHPHRPHALHERASQHRMAAMEQTATLLRLQSAFAARGIAALAYKGPVLSLQAYGSPMERICSDLDFVVRPGDAGVALSTLYECGFRGTHQFTDAEHASFRAVDGDYPLVHENTGELVELHCRVSSRRFVIDLETDSLWARRTTVRIGGMEIAATGRADTLIILAVHGAKHRWRRLEWIVSYAALMQRSSVAEIAEAFDRARAIGAGRALRLASRLANDLLGVSEPEQALMASANDSVLDSLAKEVVLAIETHGPDAAHSARDTVAFNFRILEGARNRQRFLGRWLLIPTPEDWRALRLPASLSPLYIALRPARLLATYARAGLFE